MEAERERGREEGREREGGKGGRKEGKEGEREELREGHSYIHIHPPTSFICIHSYTLTAAASWKVRLFRHALADLVTVDTQ